LILLWTLTLLAAGFARAEQSLDTIIIDAGYDKQTKIAIVPFQQGPELAHLQPISDIVSFDLARSGQFAPADDENMLSYPRTKEEVFFRDWRILGVEYLVIGNTKTDMLGNLSVDFRLFDVFNEREMVADVVSTSRDKWRDAAHRISDQIFEAVTGIPGAFSTRILYVLALNAGSPDASFRLEMADVDGERARTLFSSNEPIMSASWGPDAKRVAYV
jgi:TolB protein